MGRQCLTFVPFLLSMLSTIRRVSGFSSSIQFPFAVGSRLAALQLSNADNEAETLHREKITDTKTFYIVSDSTGVTAKTTLQRVLAQFDARDNRFFNIDNSEESEGSDVTTRLFTFIRSEGPVASIVEKAQENGALVIFTFANPSLRYQTMAMCEQKGVKFVDLFGPMLDGVSRFFQKEPMGVPMAMPRRQGTLSKDYYRLIEAIEFTLKADDGQAPWLLPQADVIIVGVSRTGKTPVSVVLSQMMGLKVANVPLVLEVLPPKELFSKDIDPQRVFALTINPNDLKKFRSTRLVEKMNRGAGESNYADRNYILRDLKRSRDLAESHGWNHVDVTGRAVEETATLISEQLNAAFHSFS